jgi:membrane complex biogenesis BtpA family protein
MKLAGPGKTVLGMVHLQPLPGTPFHESGSFQRILDTAVESAVALREGGADGCLVQTVDRVYPVEDDTDPARVAALSLIVAAIRAATGFHVGVHILRNGVRASLAVAAVAGGSFIRAGAIVGQTLTPHGMVVADPAGVMAYRRQVEAESVRIIADVASMHYTWFGGGKTTAEVARAAQGVGADAVALCDKDEAVAVAMIESVRRAAPDLPIILAGHTNHDNAARLFRHADGAFVGSCLERGGWGGRIDRDRTAAFVEIVRGVE